MDENNCASGAHDIQQVIEPNVDGNEVADIQETGTFLNMDQSGLSYTGTAEVSN